MSKPLHKKLGWTKTSDVVRIDEFLARARAASAPKTRKARSIGERISGYIDASAGPNACHPFKGFVSYGYGRIWDISPKTGQPTTRQAHVVVWEQHHQQRVPDGQHVLHARGCSKDCCNWRHLRTGDRFENMADAKAEKRLKSKKLTADKAIAICAQFDAGKSKTWLAKKYGVTEQAVWQCATGKTWSKVTNRKETYRPRKSGRPHKHGKAA